MARPIYQSTFILGHQEDPPTDKPWLIFERLLTSDGPTTRLCFATFATKEEAEFAIRDKRQWSTESGQSPGCVTHYITKEGGKWVEWKHNDFIDQPNFFAIKFENDKIWDRTVGWR